MGMTRILGFFGLATLVTLTAGVGAWQTAGDSAALNADAMKGLADAKNPPRPMPPPKPPLYLKQMDAGQTLEKQGKYDQALNAYKAALNALPGDQAARDKVDFCQAMVDGNKAMQLKKFPDAVKAYEAALRLFPDDQTAKQALQKAKTSK